MQRLLLVLQKPSRASQVVFLGSIKTCILQVLARARERGDGEECGLEEEDSDRDSSEEEDIVTEFPISNGGNSSLAEVCLPSLLNYTEPIFRTCIELIK